MLDVSKRLLFTDIKSPPKLQSVHDISTKNDVIHHSRFGIKNVGHNPDWKGMDTTSSDKNPKHYNFFRGRKRVLWCANDPNVCMDPGKNPNFGSAKTCCFQKFCKDTMKDPNNCGSCGRVCAFGLVCCDGNCVDIRNNPLHCGACFEECLGENKCTYSMCDYGG
ncbi:Uncharacterized protein Fot_54399 [Forsythia ovata]|uniref:Uncharacterized protein n=1 Tax=Forsythia ovata TaxID=205694 RepID=A0ABD1P704_9LAMI